MVNVSRENRRYGRVIIEKGLRVSMRSIGSEASYNMETRNVSDTGFFLRFEKPGRFPFTPSSIMEVWLTLEEGSTIFFNGKMTRVVYPEEAVSLETEPGIAIKIIQIEKEEESVLREFIRKKAMENEAKEKISSGSAQKKRADTEAEPLAEAPQRKTTRHKSKATKKKTTVARGKKTSTKKTSSKKTASAEKALSTAEKSPQPITVPATPTLPPPPASLVQEGEDDTSPPDLNDLLAEDEKKAG